jgi:diadenosine tetraphosphate (Ap4A) HIT family hydrolase
VSKWNDPVAWAALRDGSECPICKQGRPLNLISTFESAWLTMSEDAPMVGYVCLVSRIHVIEIHELDDAQAEAFMRDARTVSRALAAVTGAVKLNYEIHGNTLPHLHMHFFPRYAHDVFENRPIDPRGVTGPVYAPGQFLKTRDHLLLELGKNGAYSALRSCPLS